MTINNRTFNKYIYLQRAGVKTRTNFMPAQYISYYNKSFSETQVLYQKAFVPGLDLSCISYSQVDLK